MSRSVYAYTTNAGLEVSADTSGKFYLVQLYLDGPEATIAKVRRLVNLRVVDKFPVSPVAKLVDRFVTENRNLMDRIVREQDRYLKNRMPVPTRQELDALRFRLREVTEQFNRRHE